MKFSASIVAAICAVALLVSAEIVKQGERFAGGISAHFETVNGVTSWWLTIEEDDTTQASPKVDPAKLDTDDEGYSGIGEAPELVAPNGETYKVQNGHLKKKHVNPRGIVWWSRVKPAMPKPKRGM